jgi:hypothetical protein
VNKKELLRGLPKIDEVMRQESLVVLSEEKGDLLVTKAVREVIADLRASILDLKDKDAEEFDASQLEITRVAEAAAARLAEDEELNLYPVINATGPYSTLTSAGRRSAGTPSRTSREYREAIPTLNITCRRASGDHATIS